jgi:hypothetical protein
MRFLKTNLRMSYSGSEDVLMAPTRRARCAIMRIEPRICYGRSSQFTRGGIAPG